MIIITGVPGTGKTSVARELSKKMRVPLIEVNRIVREKKIYTGKEDGSYVVDMKRLKKEIENRNGVMEGHLLCEIPLKAEYVFVLRCSPKVLWRRLQKRHYSKKKIKENVEAEALDYCLIRARENYKKVYQVDTTRRTVASTVRKILRIMRGEEDDSVDFSNYFLRP
ncbi:MAG: adenylate kinase family protein [Candidatus Diapherotrites archaeon]|nr:adenylate kinase family protein [Candidatus Diapherotrites archaeon]